MGRGEEGVAASIRQRLLNLAHTKGEDFERILVRFVAERFLHRLGRSSHSDLFLLKGAMLFVAWEGMPHRATRDIDLLGNTPLSRERMTEIVGEVLAIPCEWDGVAFDADFVSVEEIRSLRERGGMRVAMTAMLGRARVRLQIDVGFGDAVTPGPQIVEFPTLLDGPPTKLRAYPVETVVAEKTLAIVERGLLNSRMKDYFDLLHLSRTRRFEGRLLVDALAATAKARNVLVDDAVVPGLGRRFSDDPSKQAQWNAFRRRMCAGDEAEPLGDVVIALEEFLGPIVAAVAERRAGSGEWMPGGPWGGHPRRRPGG